MSSLLHYIQDLIMRGLPSYRSNATIISGFQKMLGIQIWSRLLLPPYIFTFDQLSWSQANPCYISVNWEASGGGAFAVIPINEKGRLPDQLPLFRGHTAVVLDIDWRAQR